MHLPESIEHLKKRLENEGIQEIVRELSTTTTQSSKINDVEYDEDYEETSETPSEIPEPPQVAKKELNLPRQYSIDLWNGSPYMPHFENFKNDS
jgi:hypothetical protein